MEGSTVVHDGDLEVVSPGEGEPEPEEERHSLPEAVRDVAEARVTEPGGSEVDATDWFMESEVPTADEVEPLELRLNVGTSENRKFITWKIVPLPDEEFRKFRKMAMPRAARRGAGVAGLTDMDDAQYHALVVTAATVEPNLREIAQRKGVGDPSQVLRHRFRHKPGLIAQISGMVSDVSGYDDADLEVVGKGS